MSVHKKRSVLEAETVYCSARRSNGDPCKRRPMNGGSVCATHGGRAPQVRRRAEERIREAADPAAAKLVELISNKKVPYPVQLAAARDLLDRAGIGKTQPVLQVEVMPWQQDLIDVLDAREVSDQLEVGDLGGDDDENYANQNRRRAGPSQPPRPRPGSPRRGLAGP